MWDKVYEKFIVYGREESVKNNYKIKWLTF